MKLRVLILAIFSFLLSLNAYCQDSLIIGSDMTQPLWCSCDIDSLSQDEKRTCTQREMMKWFSNNIVIPKHSEKLEVIQTRVFVQYVVSKTGKVENVKILKGVHPSIDNQVKKAIEDMPDFIPGKSQGKNIDTPISLPFRIELK